jgi:hypothetical protein
MRVKIKGKYWAITMADLFLYSYEAEFVQKLLQNNNNNNKKKKKKTSCALQPYI